MACSLYALYIEVNKDVKYIVLRANFRVVVFYHMIFNSLWP